MVEYTRTTLARHLAKALLYSSVVVGIESLGVGLLLNAGAAIYCADLAVDLAAGIEQAKRVINSGSAQRKLDDLVHLTQGFNAS